MHTGARVEIPSSLLLPRAATANALWSLFPLLVIVIALNKILITQFLGY